MSIIFNGRTYNSLEEMPVNERQAYEQLQRIFVDSNGNGIPDFLEGDLAQKVITAITSHVNYGGKFYNNLNELPPEARQKVQEAFTKLNQLGILNSNPTAQGSPQPPNFDFAFQPSTPMIPKESAIEESGAKRTSWLALVLVLVIVLIVFGAGLVFLLFAR